MKIIEPWPDSEFGKRRVNEAVSVLFGMPLVGVRYFGSEFAAPALSSSHSGFDTVLKGVELTCSSHRLNVMWMIEGVREGLGFVVDPDQQFYEDEGLRAVDVSSELHWVPRLGVPVMSSGVGWQLSDDDAMRGIWSFSLGFGERSVTMALGEASETGIGITYQPDSVAVIFDESIARRYRIPASAEPAWVLR